MADTHQATDPNVASAEPKLLLAVMTPCKAQARR